MVPKFLLLGILVVGCLVALAIPQFVQRQPSSGPAQSSSSPEDWVEKIDSEYNSIIVEKKGTRIVLYFGYRGMRYLEFESVIDLSRKDELVVPYTRYMSAALAYSRSPVRRIALVGLGGGRTIGYLTDSLEGSSADVAELDPAVVDVARRHFDIRPSERLRVHTQDGRVYFSSVSGTYDLILLDAYRGGFVPFHLTTREFYQLVKSRLSAGGIVAQNVDPNSLFFDSVLATMRTVFDQVDAFDAGGNIVLVAYSGEKLSDEQLHAAAAQWQGGYKLRYDLRDLVRSRKDFPTAASAKVLTDDFAPVESLKAIVRHNEKRE